MPLCEIVVVTVWLLNGCGFDPFCVEEPSERYAYVPSFGGLAPPGGAGFVVAVGVPFDPDGAVVPAGAFVEPGFVEAFAAAVEPGSAEAVAPGDADTPRLTLDCFVFPHAPKTIAIRTRNNSDFFTLGASRFDKPEQSRGKTWMSPPVRIVSG